MRKEEIDLQVLGNQFVFGELFAIISGDGMRAIANWLGQIDYGVADHGGRAPFHLA